MTTRQCRFCDTLTMTVPTEKWNTALLESPNFVVLPSLGALVEGWLLVVPKQHALCVGALSAFVLDELNEIKDAISLALERVYGPICAFEHGPSKPNTAVGCSVDHAHLHLVPSSFDLGSAAEEYLPAGAQWTPARLQDCRTAHHSLSNYLYFEQPIGVGYITTHPKLGSQVFRRAFAKAGGRPDQFNWREYDHLPQVLATIANAYRWSENLNLWQSQIQAVA